MDLEFVLNLSMFFFWILLNAVLGAQSQLSSEESTVEAFLKPLDNMALWSALYPAQHPSFVDNDFEAFGWGQPGVRRACWGTVQTLLKIYRG
jgi:E3 ubiquitin-protein ligase listerin